MAYQKLPGIYRKEDPSPAKQANTFYRGGEGAEKLERRLDRIARKARKSEQKGYKKYLKKNKKIDTRDNYMDFMAGGKHHSKRTKRLHKRFEKIEDKLHEAYDKKK